jgi:hypothetical protein
MTRFSTAALIVTSDNGTTARNASVPALDLGYVGIYVSDMINYS